MRYVTIKGTEMKMSIIGYGTTSLGVNQTQHEADQLLSSYLALGGNYIDTASMYSDWIAGEKSRSEKTIGRWLAEHGRRNTFYLGTKGGHPGFGAARRPRVNRQDLEFDLDSSLKNMNTDYIDLYWLHRDDPDMNVDEILSIMEAFVKSGKIRSYACSNWTLPRVIDADHAARQHGWLGFSANQIEWSCTRINSENIRDKTMVHMDPETLGFHNQSAMPVFAFTSQAGGLYDRILQHGFDGVPDFMQAKYRNQATEQIADIILDYVKDKPITPTQMALAYLHARKDQFALVTLAGTNNPDHLTSIMASSDIEIPQEIVNQISQHLFAD